MDHPGRAAPADLTIVVPTYNEREGIAGLVDAVFRSCDAEQLRLELVIVDDNSPDGTGALADDLAKRHRIRVIHRSGKLGLGTAVVAGFGVATAGIVGVMDADFSHPPALVPKLFTIFRATGADIVVASRYIPGGRTLNWPVTRRVLSRVACMMARPLSPIRDAASGFFLIKRDIGTSVSIKAGGFKICLELIVRAWPRRLVEVPYQFDNRELGESKMSTREAMGYLAQLKDLFSLRMTGGSRARREYRQLTLDDMDAMVRTRAGVSASR
jgi:dolichol-phosphate mannosyltransferase